MNLKCSLGRVLQTLNMGVNDHMGWMLATNRYWHDSSFLTPFFFAYLGIKEWIGIHEWLTPSPVEMSSLTHVLFSVIKLVTHPHWSLFWFGFHVSSITNVLPQYNYTVFYMLLLGKAIRKERIRAKREAGKASVREYSLNLQWLVLALTSVSTKCMFLYVPSWFLAVFILCVYCIVFPAAVCPG